MCDVLEPALPHVLKGNIDPAMDVFLHSAGNANPTRLRQRLQPSRHVYAIAPHIAAVDDDVADIDADSELDPPLLRHVGVASRNGALNLDGTAYRSYRARELHQQPITGDPDNSASVLRYLGRDKFAPVCLPLGERAFLVSTDKPTVASYIGRENGHEPALHSRADQRQLGHASMTPL